MGDLKNVMKKNEKDRNRFGLVVVLLYFRLWREGITTRSTKAFIAFLLFNLAIHTRNHFPVKIAKLNILIFLFQD